MLNRLFMAVWLILFNIQAFTQTGDEHVDKAWEAWETQNLQMVQDLFQKAIASDSGNIRAHLGLAYLYNLQHQYQDAWRSYQQALKHAPDPQPYLYAAWSTAKILDNREKAESGIVSLFHHLGSHKTNHSIMQALANQALGEIYQRRNQPDSSNNYFAKLGALKIWSLIGPFDNVSASGFERRFAPEKSFEPQKLYEGKNGIPANWFDITEIRPDFWIDFRRYFAHLESVFYANTFVYSEIEREIQLRIGTSGSLKAFVNDEVALSHFDENNNDLDTYIAATRLQKGWNRLLIKVGFSEIDRCNFLVRITDPSGNQIPGLKYSTAKQKYRQKPGVQSRQIRNFAETYFEEQIRLNPDHLENYLLLSDCYLRNDKAIEGELVLRQAIQRSPRNILLLTQILEAYTRGEKYDEIATTMEQIYALAPVVPEVLAYKIDRFLESEQIDRAAEVLKELEGLQPGATMTYESRLAILSNQRDYQGFVRVAEEAYKSHPDNWQLASQQANVSFQTTRSYYGSVEIYQDFLTRNYNSVTLATLANTFLKASDVDKWEDTINKVFLIDPTLTGYRFNMAETYINLQRYAQAEEALLNCIDICPNSSLYWEKLAEVYSATDRPNEAKSTYKKALQFDPTNYDAREKLRTLEGKPSVFVNFGNNNIDSLIAAAPDAHAYPDDDALILLNDLQRVVYPGGASESAQTFLVKLFNNRGVDSYKEYVIGFNGYTEQLKVEKAATLKPDGSEITADVNRNQVIFKSMEPGDCLIIQWKIKNFYSGKLSNHFWDRFIFDGFSPVKEIRYRLLVPKKFYFNYVTQNMSLEPKKNKTSDGELYEWRLQDIPAIRYEYDMPILADIGKALYISSIKDWKYMIDWYIDLASSKTRSSFEIREKVAQLMRGKENAVDEEKIRIIFDFVTENIRYSSVSFRQSGLIPQKARDVLVSKIGDCKDVSTLCIAMLNEVGIDAHYVLVNTRDEGLNRNTLPSISFNHCIAGVETANGIRYLDLTAENYAYTTVPEMDMEAFSLLIKPGTESPEYIPAANFTPRNIERQMLVDVADQNQITVRKSGVRKGSLAAAMRNSFRDQGEKNIRQMLTESLSAEFPNIQLLEVSFNQLDTLSAHMDFSYSFLAPDYVSEVEDFKFLKIPWTDNLTSERALSYEERQYPYLFWPGADTLVEEVEIKLPPGFAPLALGKDYELVTPVAEYRLTLRENDRSVFGRREMIYKKSVVTPAEYREFRSFFNTVVKQDARQILLQRKPPAP